MTRPLVIAHRSCPLDAPQPQVENSAAGIRAAVALGADAVEIDVRRSRGDGLVTIHDPLGWRLLRYPGFVRWAPERWLTARRLRGSSELLPALTTAIAAVPPGVRIAVDLKVPSALVPAVAVLRSAGRLGDAMLWCRRPATVLAMAQVAPGVPTALLRNTSDRAATTRYLDEAVAVGATAVSLHERAVDADVVAAAHGRGLVAYAWALSPRSHAPLLDAGVDGITTDWPGLLARELSGLG
ncbi:MAG: glycerophosphodiester phosphodiesterase [Frankiaceae bacterium]